MSDTVTRPVRLFIVGVGRSGTSLLQAMLGSHPEIEFLPETGFLRRHVLSGPRVQPSLDAEGIRKLARDYREDTRLARVDDAADAIESVVEQTLDGDERSARQLSLDLYERLADGLSGRFAGDKDPRLVEHLEALARLRPDCRIVHIHRDPRDVLASKKAARWSAGQGIVRQVLASAAQFDLAIRAERRLPAPMLHTLSYDALLTHPDTVLSDLCDWLGVAYTPEMLDFASTARKLVAPDELEWKARTIGPLLSENSGGWSRRLTVLETSLVESACHPAMTRGQHSRSRCGSIVVRVAGTVLGRALRVAVFAYVRHRSAGEHRGP